MILTSRAPLRKRKMSKPLQGQHRSTTNPCSQLPSPLYWAWCSWDTPGASLGQLPWLKLLAHSQTANSLQTMVGQELQPRQTRTQLLPFSSHNHFLFQSDIWGISLCFILNSEFCHERVFQKLFEHSSQLCSLQRQLIKLLWRSGGVNKIKHKTD